jgi:hypothetical protein
VTGVMGVTGPARDGCVNESVLILVGITATYLSVAYNDSGRNNDFTNRYSALTAVASNVQNHYFWSVMEKYFYLF